MFPYQLSDRTLTVYVGNNTYQTDRSNPCWEQIKAALNNPATHDDEMIALMKPINAIATALRGQTEVTVVGSRVMYGDEPVHHVLANRIMDVLSEGFNIDPWLRFATNVYANPYGWSRDELYLFLEKAELPLTDDGCFIAYKKVRSDYTDIHSGRFSNQIGQIVSMPREQVDKNRNNTCSTGLHFCSKGYLPSFGGGYGSRVVLVKINPADVVSIPSDYDNTKGRTWRYEVVGEIPEDQVRDILWPAVARGYDEHVWGPEDWSEDEDDETNYGFLEDDDDDVLYVLSASGITAEATTDTLGEAIDKAVAQTKVVIETIANGLIDDDRFNNLVQRYGTKAGVARALGVSTGTVQAWATRLFGPATK